MAYSKDRGDSSMRRRGGRRRKKVCISAQIRIIQSSTTRMLIS